MTNEIIYVLTKEDIQNVAQQEIGRDLTLIEIRKIKDNIAEKINWYEAIAYVINEKFQQQ